MHALTCTHVHIHTCSIHTCIYIYTHAQYTHATHIYTHSYTHIHIHTHTIKHTNTHIHTPAHMRLHICQYIAQPAWVLSHSLYFLHVTRKAWAAFGNPRFCEYRFQEWLLGMCWLLIPGGMKNPEGRRWSWSCLPGSPSHPQVADSLMSCLEGSDFSYLTLSYPRGERTVSVNHESLLSSDRMDPGIWKGYNLQVEFKCCFIHIQIPSFLHTTFLEKGWLSWSVGSYNGYWQSNNKQHRDVCTRSLYISDGVSGQLQPGKLS